MSSTEASLRIPVPPVRRFAPYHKWDRNFFLLWVLLTALGIVVGFGRQIVEQIQTHQPAPSFIVRVHAAAFMGWLALLTAQAVLIRSRRADIHRKLGFVGMALAAVMVILGTAAALSVGRLQLGHGKVGPLLSTQFAGMLAFAGLAAAAFLLRKHSAAHKRLILLATLSISNAGFNRLLGWDGTPLPWLGQLLQRGGGGDLANFWPNLGALWISADVLILGMGLYDWITRRQLHPAYIAGVAYIGVLQVMAVALTVDPLWGLWKPIAIRLLGQ